jgi:hypothetical protein
VIASFINLSKIIVLISFELLSSHCPYHWHLEWFKVNVSANMRYMFDKS